MDDTKRIILVGLLSFVIIFGWQFFIAEPQRKARLDAAKALQEQVEKDAIRASAQGSALTAGSGTVDGGSALTPSDPEFSAPSDMVAGQTESASNRGTAPRIEIETPQLRGSLSLKGARIDDIKLINYRETIDPQSPAITLLKPEGQKGAFLAGFTWAARSAGSVIQSPNLGVDWQLTSGEKLTPDSPVKLAYTSGPLTIERQIEVDENFMFTITDNVRNQGGQPMRLRPESILGRFGLPPDMTDFFVLHEGAVGVLNDELKLHKYKGWRKDALKAENRQLLSQDSQGGWLGITDKYWLAALIHPQNGQVTGSVDLLHVGTDIYRTRMIGEIQTLAPGESLTHQSQFFAGAKVKKLLDSYEENLSIPRFDEAIDWGWFAILTRPLFWLLHVFGEMTGNFGVAILLATIVIKLLLFPLSYKAFKAMTAMKKLQPKMQELRQQFKGEPQELQRATLKLYQKEKVNPLSGCLPILIQMPIFFALYKTLFVTIEMRHAPFFGWVQDLSAPDPTALWNLFGLLPYEVSHWPILGTTLALGIWPLLMGASMYVQQALNPPPADPMQARIFQLMPLIFMVFLSSFAAGLVIYWTWNNVLTVMQQYVIMRRNGVKTEFDHLPGKIRDWISRKRMDGTEPVTVGSVGGDKNNNISKNTTAKAEPSEPEMHSKAKKKKPAGKKPKKPAATRGKK